MEENNEEEVQVRINPIDNRQFILAPVVESGDDRESTVKDFYQENNETVELGKLGYGIKVMHRKTNAQYIIIHFEKTKLKSNIQQKINNTLELMYNAASNYLLRLLNHYEDESNLFLIIESFNGDTLENKIIPMYYEKDKDGISEIYALSDYILEDEKNAGKKVRNDATYNKDYLTGRYGAIPVLEEFDII